MEIVGLKNHVQDDVNQLIAKFVGVKPRKFIEELDLHIQKYQIERLEDDYDYDDFLFHKVIRINRNCRMCFKNKRERHDVLVLYCKKCMGIRKQEYRELRIKHGLSASDSDSDSDSD